VCEAGKRVLTERGDKPDSLAPPEPGLLLLPHICSGTLCDISVPAPFDEVLNDDS